MNTELIVFLSAAAGTFLLTVFFSRLIIPKLISLKMGQKILEIGPRWHKNKEGTPTMGGIAFILAALVVTPIAVLLLLYHGVDWEKLLPWLLTLGLAVMSGAIGFLDDRVKIMKKQNAGLTASQKFLCQLICAGLYLLAMSLTGNVSTELYIPFFHVTLELGLLYYVFSLILITGIINSVNLTDGIDGLASSETFIAGAFFALSAFAVSSLSAVLGSAVAVGASLGFLVYNFYPARVFMGDTGSLFFGGLLVGLAYTVGNPLIILCFGFMFFAETLSVILQVTYFKLTKKRIFRMSPIHHHFEMCGWKETKIVGIFCLAALIFSSISFILEYGI